MSTSNDMDAQMRLQQLGPSHEVEATGLSRKAEPDPETGSDDADEVERSASSKSMSLFGSSYQHSLSRDSSVMRQSQQHKNRSSVAGDTTAGPYAQAPLAGRSATARGAGGGAGDDQKTSAAGPISRTKNEIRAELQSLRLILNDLENPDARMDDYSVFKNGGGSGTAVAQSFARDGLGQSASAPVVSGPSPIENLVDLRGERLARSIPHSHGMIRVHSDLNGEQLGPQNHLDQQQDTLLGVPPQQRASVESKRDRDQHSQRQPSTTTSQQPQTAGKSAGLGTKLIVVSNRLPVTIQRDPNTGEFEFKMSSGGLVSALAGVKHELPFVWVGWTGAEMAPDMQSTLYSRLEVEYDCIPVFLTAEIADRYYNGFCNDVLWPLFHYITHPPANSEGEQKFDSKFWKAYRIANRCFASEIQRIYRRGDLVWVQDYHLMLLPQMLRKAIPDIQVGFFLHTPFPSSDVFRILPDHKEILRGVLDSDLIGFHTYDYASHFVSGCSRLLGLEGSHRGVKSAHHFANVGIFPIGIDPSSFIQALDSQAVKDRIQEVRKAYTGKRIILGVDRMDYIKGIPHKIKAFERLLARYPKYRASKVTLIQIGVPSRTEVEEYQKLVSITNELVGGINGKYGSVDYSPIVFINQSVKFDLLCALYYVADACVVTSIRDGMNLVSYEYVMCQLQNHGVLILSEFAGSARSLSGAMRVNPWNTDELCSAFNDALSLDKKERHIRHWKLYHYVTTHTAAFWAKSFVKEMISSCRDTLMNKSAGQSECKRLDVQADLVDIGWVKQTKKNDWSDSSEGEKAMQPDGGSEGLEFYRLMIFNHEGTLGKAQTISDLAKPTEDFRDVLAALCADSRNIIYIISGRSADVLESWFGHLNVGLIAENGSVYRDLNRESWTPIVRSDVLLWFEDVLPVLQYFTERTPGSVLDQKQYSISWFFQNADPQFGSWQAFELKETLAEMCSSRDVELIIDEEKTLTLKPIEAKKTGAVKRVIAELQSREMELGFVFAMSGGASKADIELFNYLKDVYADHGQVQSQNYQHFPHDLSWPYVEQPSSKPPTHVLTCRVGKTELPADRFVPSYRAALDAMRELSQLTGSQPRRRLGAYRSSAANR
ncbi:Alpha,alpha-trehalose-phosphate synthase UDP-forming A [Porphyridium purpureum]|uniref:alpha,alpha-trehalose-phosphate synthase (UDP-forming) n=1 Tax=Porphyridium purpureum TaxID=35688 RepID=A0A5J4YYW4_PORPP|nr:Alpha,alpha-trehalose-phosphate synthase UDP-forming A [Porphyridium purpureum]|eukprot:POR6823..scf209_3